MSARTDAARVMNPDSPAYGESAALESMKAGAPMAGQAGALSGAAQQPTPQMDPFAGQTPFGAPSQNPGQPITAGAAVGAGPGTSALGLPQSPRDAARQDVSALGDSTIQALIAAAGRADATPSFKKLVRAVLYA
jgi:hypothetical protein